MSDPKPKTNGFLLVLTLLICCAIGILIPYSHSTLLPETDSTELAANVTSDESIVESEDAIAVNDTAETVSEEDGSPDETEGMITTSDTDELNPESNTVVPQNTPVATPTPTPVFFEPSPEAATGTWTSNQNGTWYFMVDGAPYVGWLNDTDGHRYYFGDDGLMKTGLKDIGENRYYFDEDGIMQTGNVKYKDNWYYFNEDGALEGRAKEIPEEPKEETSKVKITNEEATAQIDDTSDSSTPTAAVSDTENAVPDNDTSKNESSKSEEKESPKISSVENPIALTFSDGPSAQTEAILNVLKKNQAVATFFVVGSSITGNELALTQITASGCELGNQSYSNIDLSVFDKESISGEFNACELMITNLGLQAPAVVRTPQGVVTDAIRASAPAPIVLWSLDSGDATETDANVIAENIVSNVQVGDIILLHDADPITVDALEIALPKLIENGFHFVTVSELADNESVTLEKGQIYESIKKSDN